MSGRLPWRSLISALGLAALSLPLIAQRASRASHEDASELANQIVSAYVSWGPKLNSPNTSIELREFARQGRTVKYRLYAHGLPSDAVYSILDWPVTQSVPTVSLSGVTLSASGLAVCPGKPGSCGRPDKPNDPIGLTITPAAGEPFRVALVSGERWKAYTSVIPDPIESEDSGCLLDVVRLTPQAELVLIVVNGLANDEQATLITQSYSEARGTTITADALGHYQGAIVPFVRGKTGGTTHVMLKASNCSPSVDFAWGHR
jgi:hypothetical protein